MSLILTGQVLGDDKLCTNKGEMEHLSPAPIVFSSFLIPSAASREKLFSLVLTLFSLALLLAYLFISWLCLYYAYIVLNILYI